MHDIAIRRTRSKVGKLPRDQRDATPRLKPKRVVLKLGSRTLTAGGAELCAEFGDELEGPYGLTPPTLALAPVEGTIETD